MQKTFNYLAVIEEMTKEHVEDPSDPKRRLWLELGLRSLGYHFWKLSQYHMDDRDHEVILSAMLVTDILIWEIGRGPVEFKAVDSVREFLQSIGDCTSKEERALARADVINEVLHDAEKHLV